MIKQLSLVARYKYTEGTGAYDSEGKQFLYRTRVTLNFRGGAGKWRH
jgi:hypothetical protein